MRSFRCSSLAAALLLALPALAQQTYTEVYAVVGARVEVGDGRVIDKANLIIRNGRIAAVGPDVAVPRFANVIKGDGLTIYPGFIDAYSNALLTVPDPQPDQDELPATSEFAPPFMRLANRKGIRPELDAALYFTATPATLATERRAGFTNLVITPTGNTVNGQAALVELSGIPRRESVIKSGVAMSMGLRTTGPGYPGSAMGIQAHLRQALLDTQHFASLSGTAATPDDPALKALLPVTQKRMPVFFEADTENEIWRVLRLRNEFDFPMVLVGGQEAYKHASRLVSEKVRALIIGVDFGREPIPERAAGTPPNTGDDQPSPLRLERQERFSERAQNLGLLERAGVRFCLTGRGTRDRTEFFRNLRRAIASGLSRETALKALTVYPAELLGVSDAMGTVEAGKLANLTIMNGRFPDANMRVRYVFVRGRQFEADGERAPLRPGRRDDDEDHDHNPQKAGGL